VLLDAAAYVGRPVAEVQQQLTALGLVVQVVAEPGSAVPAGDVVAVSPDGVLSRGDTVLVTVALAPVTSSPVPPAAPAPVPEIATAASVVRVPAAPAPAPVVRAPAPAPAPVRVAPRGHEPDPPPAPPAKPVKPGKPGKPGKGKGGKGKG
jgi:serine/threonine-protein kinase